MVYAYCNILLPARRFRRPGTAAGSRYSGFRFDPLLILAFYDRADFWLTMAVTGGKNPIFVSINPHGSPSECKYIEF
jgi:hypothetical protein